MENIDLIIILTTAFLGSLGHCIGMCGGIVVAYTSSKVDPKSSYIHQTTSHLSYNFGRVATYAILGAIFGAIGQVIAFTPTTKGVLFLLPGILMILAGLSIVGRLSFLTKLEHSFSRSGWYQEVFRSVLRSRSLSSFYILGLLNGLLPCGLVYFFAVTAASTGSPLWGAFVMFIFGLSTIPSLFTLGFFAGIFTKNNLRKMMMNLAAIIVIAYGFYTVYRGYDFIEHPNKSLLNCCEVDSPKTESDSMLPKFK
jgi:sulfite exporter TauE/SafE